MSAFRWEAVDARRAASRGRARRADTARRCATSCVREGLTRRRSQPRQRCERRRLARRCGCPRRCSRSTTRQLATLTRSGMPLDQALAAVAEQADDARAAKLAADAARAGRRGRVAAGRACALSARRSPPLYRGLVGAGAETGRLAEVLARLADYLEAREALRQKFVLALIYPAHRDGHRVRGDRGAADVRRAAGRRRSTSRAGRRCRG